MKHLGTVVLETERLLLRPFTLDDTDAMFHNWANNHSVTRYLVWAAHQEPADTHKVLVNWTREYAKKDFYEWAIVPKTMVSPIGSIGLVDCVDSRKCCEAGYCIGSPWWNQGITTEALKAVIDFAFYSVGYRTVIAKHAIENPASGRVMQKAGMSMRVGETVPVSTANGRYNCVVYEIGKARRPVFFTRRYDSPYYHIRTTSVTG